MDDHDGHTIDLGPVETGGPGSTAADRIDTDAILARFTTGPYEFTDTAAVVADLCDEVDRLRVALTFYADPENYHAIAVIPDRPSGPFADDVSTDQWTDVYDRPILGHRARAALGWEGETSVCTDDEGCSAEFHDYYCPAKRDAEGADGADDE